MTLDGSTPMTLPDFDTPQLARAVESLSPNEIDQLPFGVVKLDSDKAVKVFNKTEREYSGFGERPALERLFFIDVAPCMNNGYFKGRIERAIAAGKLDVVFTFIGDFSDRDRELTVRAQPAQDGGLWIFIKRASS